MSALSFAKTAFGKEKPHSSITDWVEILTGPNLAEEAYDGIPELVESINLQPTGPTEASRALRKKLKHGNPHQQYRALVLLKALVENCSPKFLAAFSDGTLTEALRLIGSDITVNKRVKKKLLLVLGSWKEQYASDPSMSLVAGLYKQCRVSERREQNLYDLVGLNVEEEKKRIEKQKKKEEKLALKERARKEEEERRKNKNKPKRVPFNFERDRPKVIESISEASQASSNLINAITLVNIEKEKLQENARVQDCLAKAKQVRKSIVRYVQLVENEELIGTLIETNERIMNALEMYDQLTASGQPSSTDGLAERLASTTISTGEVGRLQEKQKAVIQQARSGSYREEVDSSPEPGAVHVHPDLEDLEFGPLGSSSQRLPPPMRPKRVSDDDDDEDEEERRGSLSDFSDYESSDEETHKARAAGPSKRRDYVTVSANDSLVAFANPGEEDPFADPFADSAAVKR
ncbi:hypothetical protein DFP72DRAFT_26129 [Ephemerocybe angulata]|uniref:VHS domain-containing protein n=1 Tax=Ephemerocybe angulata TaxID=980116 RepID=A0A8H6IJD0_9AGAR|nr:hypothetical protein DFP72DRAFT_26129 [Tulosesus angulatus]